MRLEPTGRNPRHYTVSFDDLEEGVQRLVSCRIKSCRTPTTTPNLSAATVDSAGFADQFQREGTTRGSGPRRYPAPSGAAPGAAAIGRSEPKVVIDIESDDGRVKELR